VFYSRAGETFGPRVKPRIPDNIPSKSNKQKNF
jgi:hypothetical protein